MNNFFKQVFLVLGCFISFWASGQQNLNLVAPITINLPNNLSANTADWNSTVPPIIITAKAGTGGIQSWLLVTIKKGGSKICGSYTPETTPEANFNAQVKTWVGATVVELLGNSCTLSPGDYEFCVQFFVKDKRTLLGESSRPFTIKETKTQSYTPPTNLTPANEKTFTEKEAKAPITFRWTPILPKPKDQVTYKLKVWQLMQGQNGIAAMKSNTPVIEKDVKDFTQYVEPNILGDIEIINKSAKLIWNVEATRQNQMGELQSLGISEPTQFTLAASTCTCSALNCPKIVTYKNTITGVTKQVPNNIQTPIVLGCNVNYYFLDETVCNGVALEGCTKIVKGEFRNVAGDLVIQQTPFSLGSFFNIRSSTPGNYNFIIKYFIDDVECSTSTIPIVVSCSNELANFCPPQFGNIWVKRANGVQIETFDFINNINKTVIISPEYENCNEDLFLGSVNFCTDTCNKQEIYTLTNDATGDVITGVNSFKIPATLADGKYSLKVDLKCGDKICKTGTFGIKKSCIKNEVPNNPPNFCPPQSGNIWVKKANGTQIETFDFINNINKTVIISPEYENCNEDLFLGSVNFCTDTCNKQEIYTLKNNATSATITGVNVLKIPSSLPNGTYSLNVVLKCGNNICKKGDFTIIKNCIPTNTCCTGGKWIPPFLKAPMPTPQNPLNYVVTILSKGNICGTNLPSVKCASYANFRFAYQCATTEKCPATITYILRNGLDNSVVNTYSNISNSANLAVLTPSTSGNYYMQAYAKCGDKICDSCVVNFKVECPIVDSVDCCKNASFKNPIVQDENENRLGDFGTCERPVVYFIDNGFNNCNKDLFVKASSNCGNDTTNCKAKIVYTLSGSNTPTIVSTQILKIPASLPTGQYFLQIEYYCGNKICKSCKFEIKKQCPPPTDCCKNTSFKSPSIMDAEGNSLGISLNCEAPKILYINEANKLCDKDFMIKASFNCGIMQQQCPSNAVITLKNSTTGAKLVNTTPGGPFSNYLIVPATLANGSYALTIDYYCGSKICKTCTFEVKKECKTNDDCCVNSTWEEKIYYPNGSQVPTIFPKDKARSLGDFDCKKNMEFKVCYKCGPNCTATIDYKVYTNTGVLQSSKLNTLSCTDVSLTVPNANGKYVLMLYAKCNGKICDSAYYFFDIKNCIVPPTDCCKNGRWLKAQYEIVNKKVDGSWDYSDATLYNFSISRVAAIPTIKADVGVSVKNLLYQCFNSAGCDAEYIITRKNVTTGALEPVEKLTAGKNDASVYSKPYPQLITIQPLCGGQKCDNAIQFYLEYLNIECGNFKKIYVGGVELIGDTLYHPCEGGIGWDMIFECNKPNSTIKTTSMLPSSFENSEFESMDLDRDGISGWSVSNYEGPLILKGYCDNKLCATRKLFIKIVCP